MWRLAEGSEPFQAPWEGRDATGWVWEILRDNESRRIIVEVSGTAMAVADEYLPRETVAAKATLGRSEVEKVLEEDEPPKRITLGTMGYVGRSIDVTARPDFVLKDEDGLPVAVVEVRNPEDLTRALASVVRDRLAELDTGGLARFFLVIAQNRGFLFRQPRDRYEPVAELPMFDVVERYYPSARREQRFHNEALALIVQRWLLDVTSAQPPQGEVERTLVAAGFLDAVAGADVQIQPQ